MLPKVLRLEFLSIPRTEVFRFQKAPGGGLKTVRIRDDAGGHDFGSGNPQNRGSHFNDEAGNHYDY